jgi:uridine phosphorylase
MASIQKRELHTLDDIQTTKELGMPSHYVTKQSSAIAIEENNKPGIKIIVTLNM